MIQARRVPLSFAITISWPFENRRIGRLELGHHADLVLGVHITFIAKQVLVSHSLRRNASLSFFAWKLLPFSNMKDKQEKWNMETHGKLLWELIQAGPAHFTDESMNDNERLKGNLAYLQKEHGFPNVHPQHFPNNYRNTVAKFGGGPGDRVKPAEGKAKSGTYFGSCRLNCSHFLLVADAASMFPLRQAAMLP
jgi:hypothetical protein